MGQGRDEPGQTPYILAVISCNSSGHDGSTHYGAGRETPDSGDPEEQRNTCEILKQVTPCRKEHRLTNINGASAEELTRTAQIGQERG